MPRNKPYMSFPAIIIISIILSAITTSIVVNSVEYSSFDDNCVVVKIDLSDVTSNSSLIYIPEYNVIVSSYYLDDLGTVYIRIIDRVLSTVLDKYDITVVDDEYINGAPAQVYAEVKSYKIESMLDNTWLGQRYYAGVRYIVARPRHVIIYNLRNIDHLDNNVIDAVKNITYRAVEDAANPLIVILLWSMNITYRTPPTNVLFKMNSSLINYSGGEWHIRTYGGTGLGVVVGIESRRNISRYLKDYELFKEFVVQHRDLIGFVSNMYRRELGIGNSTLVEIAVFDKGFWRRNGSSGFEGISNENGFGNTGGRNYTGNHDDGSYVNTVQGTKALGPLVNHGGIEYIIPVISLFLVVVAVGTIVIYRKVRGGR